MDVGIWGWALFTIGILGLLALDLGVFNRHAGVVSMRAAAVWSGIWIALALLFNVGIALASGADPALAFLTGYLVEKSLAIDNIFVFVLIFGAFAVPPAYQRRVLFWGVISALVMRGAMIALGSYLIARADWVLYAFGAFLLITGIRMLRHEAKPLDPSQNVIVRAVRRVLPVTNGYRDARFLARQGGRLMATPMLLVLMLIEGADLAFAVDSIPAVFAVTQDPFLVYTSNVFAILGLRSLYFLLAGVIDRFHLLRYGLAAVLAFVGGKMLIGDLYHLPSLLSLVVILGLIGASILASLRFPPARARPERTPVEMT